MQRPTAEWRRILAACGCDAEAVDQWAPIFAAHIGPDTFSLDDEELSDFIGQVLHESGMLERLVEGLNYRKPERIQTVWPSRFATVEAAAPFAENPEGLANKVYGGRLGNDRPGDGWRYRGRGLLQVTGRRNYQALSAALGIDLVGNPELLAQPETALLACIAWWEGNVPDEIMDNTGKVTKAVNGGQHGLADREKLTNLAAEALRRSA
jgi:putative chitinase